MEGVLWARYRRRSKHTEKNNKKEQRERLPGRRPTLRRRLLDGQTPRPLRHVHVWFAQHQHLKNAQKDARLSRKFRKFSIVCQPREKRIGDLVWNHSRIKISTKRCCSSMIGLHSKPSRWNQGNGVRIGREKPGTWFSTLIPEITLVLVWTCWEPNENYSKKWFSFYWKMKNEETWTRTWLEPSKNPVKLGKTQ